MVRTEVDALPLAGESPQARAATGTKKLVVGLLSHYFRHPNLGCVALSVSNVALMDRAAQRAGVEVEYVVLANEEGDRFPADISRSAWTYRAFPRTREALVNPVGFLRTRVFDGCDLVVNINGGDGFTDVYGLARLVSEVYMTSSAQSRGLPVLLAPQTIGPFTRRISRSIARAVLGRSEVIFARDRLSTQVCASLGAGGAAQEVIDVAFALPYMPTPPQERDAQHVGVNVSGLLYRGGYDRRNYFGLAFDYADFVHRSVRAFLERGMRVHLIPHVLEDSTSVEDDFSACLAVARLCRGAVVAPRFDDPSQAKSYISGMDFFTGARMHSTIAAFSSGVPVVPIGYSDKLPGLFDTLGYPYYVDARDSVLTAESASARILSWFDRRSEVRDALAIGQSVANVRAARYVETLAEAFTKVVHERCAG